MEIKNYSMWKFKWGVYLDNDTTKHHFSAFQIDQTKNEKIFLVKGYSSDSEIKGFNFHLSYKIN